MITKISLFVAVFFLCTAFSLPARSQAQAPPVQPASMEVSGQILDPSGFNIPNAQLTAGPVTTHADATGRFTLQVPPSSTVPWRIEAPGFTPKSVFMTSTSFAIVLQPATITQSATVTATRTASDFGPVARTISVLSATQLTQYPALTLDERLRQHAGFELFRRSSSWVANPTTEGISLRGLGSTAASRTLVLAAGIPLNDPFGGWIHWNELPPETIESVTIASGGGSDLYGSSALGGVIDINPAQPASDTIPVLAEATLAEAGESTTPLSGRLDFSHKQNHLLTAGHSFRTAGYTVIAPAVRGPIDIPSNVHFQTGRLEFDRALTPTTRLFLNGNLLDEARSNGTPLQTNGTRLWRYSTGADLAPTAAITTRLRAFGSNEAYRQVFSAINATRSAETLTRLQAVRTQETGASADAAIPLFHAAFSLVLGGDFRDLRATDLETPITNNAPSGLQDVSARQRFAGGFFELLAQHGPWSGAFSLRTDSAQNLATHTLTLTANTPTPDRQELIVSPRLGLERTLPRGFAIHASGFRAFRAPTMNELYRTGQVGQQTTLANPNLLLERATGAEAALDFATSRATLHATYFFTEINRPVSAILLRSTPTTITNQRENLGQIQSQGTKLSAELRLARTLTFTPAYQYAHATVTAFQPQPSLVGLEIPEVPRHTATAQLRYTPHLFQSSSPTSFTLAARTSGRAFDDSSNIYELHAFTVFDFYAQQQVHSHYTLFLSLQNLLNRSIETARTPTLTLGTPFVAQGGIRLRFGAAQ